MRCEVTEDPGEFWSWTERFLFDDPVANNVLLSNVTQRRDGRVTDPRPATYIAVRDAGGAVVGAVMRTLPHTAYVSRLPADAVAPLVSVLHDACPELSGVTGTSAEAEAVACAWCDRYGGAPELAIAQRIHVLGELAAPAGVPGQYRLAGGADAELVQTWERDFAAEAESVMDPEARVRGAELRVAEGRALLWEDTVAGRAEPVSYTGHTGPMAGVVRVGPVYTPPDRRGHGYASALVAAVSRRVLDAGANRVCLYTDQANPTSNKIYAAIGYRSVCDVTSYRFHSRDYREVPTADGS